MAFNEFQFSAWSAHHCSAHFVSRVPAEPGNVVSSQLACAAAGGGEGIPSAAIGSSHSYGLGFKRLKKEGVDSVHTWGFGFGCTGIGPGRIADVFERAADLREERLVRVPPRARVSPVQGLVSL
jgi:hypothetical protein